MIPHQQSMGPVSPSEFKEAKLDASWKRAQDELTPQARLALSYRKMMHDEPKMITHITSNQTITPDLAANIKEAYGYSDKNISSLRSLDGQHAILLELQSGNSVTDVLQDAGKLIAANPKATIVFVHSGDREHIVTISDDNGSLSIVKK